MASAFVRFRSALFAFVPAVFALSFLIFALSFSTWYEGDTQRRGVADRLFGSITIGGWRGDVVYLFAATVVALIAIAMALPCWSTERRAKRTLLLSAAWVVCSVLYAAHIVRSGLLYMGSAARA